MTATDYLEAKILDHVLSLIPYTPPTSMWLCLHTNDPSETGTVAQVSGGSYTPQLITFSLDNYGSRLTNGSLEGTPGAGLASGWTTPATTVIFSASIVAGGVAGNFQRLTGTFRTDPNALPIQMMQTVTGISDVVGQVVRLAAYTKSSYTGSGGSATGYLVAEVYNSTNVLLGGVRSVNFGVSTGFTYRTLDWTMPAGASYAKVWFEARASLFSDNQSISWDVDEMFFGLADTNQRVSSNSQTFTNMPAVTVSHFVIRENSGTGQPMLSAPLSFNRGVAAGDPLIFGPGQIVVRADQEVTVPVVWMDACEDAEQTDSAGFVQYVPGRHGLGMHITYDSHSASGHTFSGIYPYVDSVTMGFAIRIPTLGAAQSGAPGYGGIAHIVGMYDEVATSAFTQIGLGVRNDGSMYVRTGPIDSYSTNIANTPPGTIPQDSWVYIEWKVNRSSSGTATDGLVHIRVNNTTVFFNDALNTRITGTYQQYNGRYFQTCIGSDQTGSTGAIWDDMYVATGEDFVMLGDSVVGYVYPNGNGASSQWRGNDNNSVDNYLLVNETDMSSSNNVRATLPTTRDLYQLGDIARTGRIHAISHSAWVGVGTGRNAFRLVSHGTGDAVSQTFSPNNTSNTIYHWTLETNPDTGLPWTEAEVNALQAGIEIPLTP